MEAHAAVRRAGGEVGSHVSQEQTDAVAGAGSSTSLRVHGLGEGSDVLLLGRELGVEDLHDGAHGVGTHARGGGHEGEEIVDKGAHTRGALESCELGNCLVRAGKEEREDLVVCNAGHVPGDESRGEELGAPRLKHLLVGDAGRVLVFGLGSKAEDGVDDAPVALEVYLVDKGVKGKVNVRAQGRVALGRVEVRRPKGLREVAQDGVGLAEGGAVSRAQSWHLLKGVHLRETWCLEVSLAEVHLRVLKNGTALEGEEGGAQGVCRGGVGEHLHGLCVGTSRDDCHAVGQHVEDELPLRAASGIGCGHEVACRCPCQVCVWVRLQFQVVHKPE
mmetsp:Transcript_1711/g.5297  ORF Transcript_1711/g.5297 Transcript_1711/m.5297 type:complete len:332 (+) Transcript_1711:568-1563(+)